MIAAPINLPLTIARCPATRQVPCAKSADCARALVDGKGRNVQDYSIDARGADGACLSHMPAHKYRQAPAPGRAYLPTRGLFCGE